MARANDPDLDMYEALTHFLNAVKTAFEEAIAQNNRIRGIEKNPFVYHLVNDRQRHTVGCLQDGYREIYDEIVKHVPPNRQRSLALTKLQESMMWASAAVAMEDAE